MANESTKERVQRYMAGTTRTTFAEEVVLDLFTRPSRGNGGFIPPDPREAQLTVQALEELVVSGYLVYHDEQQASGEHKRGYRLVVEAKQAVEAPSPRGPAILVH